MKALKIQEVNINARLKILKFRKTNIMEMKDEILRE